jgi:hypothetical protein
MKKLVIYFLLLLVFPINLLAQEDNATKTVGSSSDYLTLQQAFSAINDGMLTGVVTLQLTSSFSESNTAVLYESGHNGASNYTAVIIYPTGAGNYTIDGDYDGPLIDLDGADNVTIDGRVGASGSTKALTITNINAGTSASTIQFINDASSNIVQYCTIKGSETSGTSGVIFFSSAAGAGNDGNTIDHNDITSYYDGVTLTRPINAIYSLGTLSSENSGNTISNNNIYDFLKHGTASNGIFLSSNTTTWTITGNSFYETTPFNPTAAVTYYVIQINNTSGNGFTLTGNYIGGNSASCNGTWTKNANARNNVFYAIYLNVGSSTASSVQNNTIKNISWSNSAAAAWTGIHIAAGDLNIGTVSGNTIGATTGNGSLTVTNSTDGANVYGINIAGTGTVDCQYNAIGSFTVANSNPSYAINITGINKTSTTGTTTISNNSIGSTSQSGSISATSTSSSSAQSVFGINNAGTGTVTIESNTIANMTNGTTNATVGISGRINGISSVAGATSILNNTIRDLTIANANNSPLQSASVCGIALTGNSAAKTISGNTVYNLRNTYLSFAGSVIGLYFNGSTGSNAVKENFIHSLSVTGASSTTASIYGIKIFSGTTVYSNNIIYIGGSSRTTIYGIYETGASGNNNKLYFNTVYIAGDGNGGTNLSYALYSAVSSNTRDFRNNILVNLRETLSTTNKHYAAFIASGGAITCDFNNYLVSQTVNGGGTLGNYGGDKTALPIVTSQDVSSFSVNPGFSSPGGTDAANYQASHASLVAVTGTGITTDYDGGAARNSSYPSMGAFEYTVAPGAWTWTGTTSTNWSTATNWNYNVVPPSSGNVIIADVTNDPIVNEAPATPAQCQNLTINNLAILTVAAGKALEVTGTITNYAGNTGLVIKSDANGNDGKLKNDTPSVPATVELFLSGGTGSLGPIFHYIVPPVASMTIVTSTDSLGDARTNLGLNFTNFKGDLMAYSEVAAGANKNNGWQYFDNYKATAGFPALYSSLGYNFRLAVAGVATFKGLLNASAHTFSGLSFTNLGFNLVGNPYPCNYNLTGISALTTTGDYVDNTIYFNNDGGYAYYNVGTGAGTTGYTAIMPPMQGFMVRVSATGQSLSLPVGSKTTSVAGPMRSKGYDVSDSKGTTLVKKVKLVLSNSVTRDETIVCLIDNATTNFDGDYDAYKFFGSTSVPYIYTDMNSVKYAINSVQEPAASTSKTIPVTVVIKNAGDYKIDISEFENLSGVNVVLKHGAIETVLSKDVSYSFTSAAGTFTDFELILGNSDISTSIEPVTNEKLKTWYNNRFLYLNCPADLLSDRTRLVIYDTQGKMVYNDNISLTSGQTIQVPINLPKGLYITHININNQQIVTKIVVL